MATGGACKPDLAQCCTSRCTSTDQQSARVSSRGRLSLAGSYTLCKETRGSSCSTNLCTTAVEICTTVLPSSQLCLPEVMAYLWVFVNKSTSSAVEVWPVHESAAERAWGRRTAFYLIFLHDSLERRRRVSCVKIALQYSKEESVECATKIVHLFTVSIPSSKQTVNWSAVSESSIALARLTSWSISMKLGTLIHHALNYIRLPQNFFFFCQNLSRSKKMG